jgi:outer membrane protein assembly factor BamA
LLASGSIPGGDGGTVSAPGLRLLWEARDRRYSPGKGFFFDIKAAFSAKVLGASSNNYMIEADYRSYYTIFPENILALNVVTKFSGEGTPLRAIPRLGGMYLMRGYYEGRYTDCDYIAGQVEYRFPLFWTFRGAVYASAGQVAPRIDYFKTGGVKISCGLGIHWKPFDFMDSPLRFDLAFSGSEPQLYLDLMEAF